MKFRLSLLIILFLICSLFAGCTDSTESSYQNEETTESGMQTSIPANEIVTKFEQFEKGLNDANIDFQSTVMGAELIGAEEGKKYKLNGESVELYRFDENSDEFKDVIQYKAVKLEGFGSIPVDINGNMALITENLNDKGKILEIFNSLN